MFDTQRRDRVAVLTLAHPPVNAMSPDWVAAFHAKLDALEADDGWTVLHIRSAQKVFCAGADLKHMAACFASSDRQKLFEADTRAYQALFARVERLARPTIAEIAGAALGGGFELALACDFRIAAEEAKMGLPEVRLGLLPGAGGTQRLTRLVGPGLARRIILGCEVVDGRTARDLGLVQFAAPRAELISAGDALADRVAALPSLALQRAKACLAAYFDPARDGFDTEVEGTVTLIETEETQAQVAAFLEQGK